MDRQAQGSWPLVGKLLLLAILMLLAGLAALFFKPPVAPDAAPLAASLTTLNRHLRNFGRRGFQTAQPPIAAEPEIQRIAAQLAHNASTGDFASLTVMMTIVDAEGSKTLLPLFLSSLCRANARLAGQLLVICVSAEAYEACQGTYATCMYDKAAEERNAELAKLGPGPGKRVQSPLFLQIGWDKLERLFLVLQKHVHVFFVDSDIVWLSDPLPALHANAADIQLTHDGWGPNIGVMFLRPTNSSLAFMDVWLARRTAPDSRDQYEFQAAVDATAQSHELQVAYVDKGQFPNGCCCGHALPVNRAQAERWVLWHAACVGDLASKRNSLLRIDHAAAALRPHADSMCDAQM